MYCIIQNHFILQLVNLTSHSVTFVGRNIFNNSIHNLNHFFVRECVRYINSEAAKLKMAFKCTMPKSVPHQQRGFDS